MSDVCKSCVIAKGQETVPYIYQDRLWTVNLLLGPPPPKLLLGRAVLQPRRHIISLHDFNVEEQHSLGLVLSRCEFAMKEILGVERVYTCLFAEDPDFHLHIHLIPRRPNLPKEYIGHSIFNIRYPEFDLASPAEVEEVHIRLKAALMAAET